MLIVLLTMLEFKFNSGSILHRIVVFEKVAHLINYKQLTDVPLWISGIIAAMLNHFPIPAIAKKVSRLHRYYSTSFIFQQY